MTSTSAPPRPIAIIGMGMRLPGGVSTGDDFWKLIVNKKNGRCRVPESRYNLNGFRGESHKENVDTEYGHFLQDVNLGAYDTSFFQKNRSEAASTDPQQRILLEVVWECMESAGVTNLAGTKTGVYVGCYGEDWQQVVYQDKQSSSAFRVATTADFILSNRISYQFDLRGPSLTIRTACAAAMTGLHLACQALQTGDCSAAIVAGSSIILCPSMTQDMSVSGMLAPDGHCKTFDASADGFARAEGVNAILIKPLEDAIRDNDPIRGIIRSTAIGSDGKTSSMGAPSTEAQVSLIRSAYNFAGITDFSQTAFVECHGTGTKVGDPIEAAAVGQVFGDAGVYIGSVKPNLGHTEGAAGLTGLIKAVLALENETIPPNINFSTPNPRIAFDQYKLRVPIEPVPWPKDRHQRVSINCFGMGGANAHVILDSAASFGIPRQSEIELIEHKPSRIDETAPQAANETTNRARLACGTDANGYPTGSGVAADRLHETSNGGGTGGVNITNGASNGITGDVCNVKTGDIVHQDSENKVSEKVTERRPVLLALSASSEKSLKSRVTDIRQYVSSRSPCVDAVAYNLGTRRVHLSHRTFCIADGSDVSLVFEPFGKGPPSALDIAFVFTGQGAQWAGMSKDLCRWMPSFLNDIQEMDRILGSLNEPAEWKIEDLLCSEIGTEVISKAEFAQPLTTAVQIALARLLISCGIGPSAVVGHSSGEIAAAYVAGALTLSEAIICSYHRGLMMKSHKLPSGRMAAIGLGREQVAEFLEDGVQVACENSPKSVTLSGDTEALERVMRVIKDNNANTFVRQLQVNVAYHSDHMRQVGADYEASLSPYVVAKQATLPLYSSVTGHLTASNSSFGPSYWRENLESPVLFSSAVTNLLRNLNRNPVLIEVGPHSALQGPLRQIFQAHRGTSQPPTYVATVVKDKSPTRSFLATIGHLYCLGCPVDFSFINPASHTLVDLPHYPWDHSIEMWHESRVSKDWRLREYPHDELLGSSCSETTGLQKIWRNLLSLGDVPWLSDHVIAGDKVFPCAAYVAMMGEAIRQSTGSKSYELKDLVIKSAMVIHEAETLEIMTSMSLSRLTEYTSSSWYEFSISSFNGNSWVQHCIAHGKSTESTVTQPTNDRCEAILSPLPRKVPEKYFYKKMDRMGLSFGSCFRCLEDISAHTQEFIARATIRNDGTRDGGQRSTHATTIDACLQLSVVAASKGIGRQMATLRVPARIGSIRVFSGDGIKLAAESVMQFAEGADLGKADIIAITGDQKVAVHVQQASFVQLNTGGDEGAQNQEGQSLARLEWRRHIDFSDAAELFKGATSARARNIVLTWERFNVLCILEFLDVMESLKLSPPPGYLTQYVAWLEKEKQRMLNGEHRLIPEAAEWASTAAESRKVIFGSVSAEVDLLGYEKLSKACNMSLVTLQPDHIEGIMSGEIHPLQIYTQDDGLSNIYKQLDDCLYSGDFFSLCSHAQPNLKVLEIGGGTASTTLTTLGHLMSPSGTRMYSTYVFTDISTGFFSSARKLLEKYEGIDYKVLDITKDPADQGFLLGEYDIVVASNVLHATPSLRESLKNAHRLLRPGGRLYLQELIIPTNLTIVPFVMGLFPGWWLGHDDDRADQPLISVERWNQELRAAGFSGVDAAVANDDAEYQVVSHILSSVPLAEAFKKTVVFLYNRERPDFAKQLASTLETKEIMVHWVSIHEQEWADMQDIVSVIELEGPFLSSISKDDYTDFMSCLATIKGGLLWLTRSAQVRCTNPAYGLVIGLARTARLEMSLDFWTTELENLDTATIDAAASIACRFLGRVPGAGRQVDCEFSVHNGAVHVGRYDWTSMKEALNATTHQSVGSKQMVIGKPGILDSMHWIQHADSVPQPHEVEVQMHCVGLNFRDIMIGMGLIPGASSMLGCEAAGVVTRVGSNINYLKQGDRVMVLYRGLFATRRIVNATAVVRIPDDLSFEGAATMGIVFCTVVYAIINKGDLGKGQSILIHSAAGGVGQAALQICKMLDADIYVTAGSEDKVQYIVQNYGLPRERIFSSRNTSFYDGIMHATKGRGVDMVLNSLSGELLHASWRCVAKWGKMMEIGKRDIFEHGQLPMDMFGGNRTFYGIDLVEILDHLDIFSNVTAQVLKYYSEGYIKPVTPINAFLASDLLGAFRYMQSGKHIGKVIITMPEDSSEITATAAAEMTFLSSSSTYLLVGGLGGLGRVVATWMVEKGARSLVFLSRSAGVSADDKAFLLELKSQGCSAVSIAGSVMEMEDVMRSVEAAPTPIAGVIQMSMVLEDVQLLQMSYDDWNTVQGPKVTGTWNLHNALLGTDLDFFILFSSITAAHGNYGQASYASANSFLGSFVQYRHSLGLPCSAIDIGAMDGVGAVGHLSQREKQLTGMGVVFLPEQALVEAIQLCITQSASLAKPVDYTAMPYVNKDHFLIGLESTKSLNDPANKHPMRHDIRMALAYQRMQISSHDTSTRNEGIRALLSMIASDPGTLDQQSTMDQVAMEIGRTLCSFLMIPEDDLNADTTLETMGVDSLVSIEIRNWWINTLGVDISVLDITNAGKVARLGTLAVESLKKKYQLVSDEPEAVGISGAGLTQAFASYMDSLSDYQGSILDKLANAPLPEKATIFLTGATGFLGCEILGHLLRTGRVGVVIVHVRAASAESGMERIRETAKISGWWRPEDETRIEIWQGDLSSPSLGLVREQILRLQGCSTDDANVDAIIHNGAVVNMAISFEALRQPNVDATVELLKLALSSPRAPKFVYVSGSLKMVQGQPFEALAPLLSTHFGYSQTKILSESIVLEIASRMPQGQNRISVVKPGLIAGAVNRGVVNVDDLVWHVVAASVAFRRFPEYDSDRWVYVSGVDGIAAKVVQQLLASEDMESFVDIVDGVSIVKFWGIMCEELGMQYTGQPWKDWTDTVMMDAHNIANSQTITSLFNFISDNSAAFPKEQPFRNEEMQQVQLALRSTVQYLRHVGVLQTSTKEKNRSMVATINRNRV